MRERPLIVVGLGNPGAEYANTRHNLGFHVMDTLAGKWGVRMRRSRWHGWVWRGERPSGRVALLKPYTFVNSSGLAVKAMVQALGVKPEDLLVVCDDLSLAPGRLRLRARGSDGGHKGLRSIIEHWGTEEFARLRIGIGAPPPGVDSIDYVLGEPEGEEALVLAAAVLRAAECVEAVLDGGLARAMDQFNSGATGL